MEIDTKITVDVPINNAVLDGILVYLNQSVTGEIMIRMIGDETEDYIDVFTRDIDLIGLIEQTYSDGAYKGFTETIQCVIDNNKHRELSNTCKEFEDDMRRNKNEVTGE